MKRKKAFLLIVLGLLLVTSCYTVNRDYEDSAKDESQITIVDDSVDEITLEIYSWQDSEVIINKLAKEYMLQNPGIIIHTNFIPSTEYVQQMKILKRRNEQVDCIFSPSPAAALVLANKGLLKDVSSWIQEQVDESKYSKWFNEEDELCRSYMLPYRVSRWVVYYNKTLFDKMGAAYPKEGWTWEDYENIAVQLTGETEHGKTYGSLSYEPYSIWWRVPARTAGACDPFQTEDLKEFKKAAEWNYHLTYDLNVQEPYHQKTGSGGSNYTGNFLTGNVGMFYCGEWAMEEINREITESYPDFTYDIAPMPRWEGQDYYIISDASVISMVETTKHPNEAFNFMKYITGYEGAKLLAQNYSIPAWTSKEIIDIFMNSTVMPEHTDYFFEQGNIESNPTNVRFVEAMEIVRDEVTFYLLQEQNSDQTFDNIQEKLDELKKETP